MSRPGFVLEVDGRTPPLLISEGSGCRLERLPLGSRVVYPNGSLPQLPDLEESIGQAIAAPLDQPPLTSQLKAGLKVAIVFSDNTHPMLGMSRPDVRVRVLEQLLEHSAKAGIEDIQLIAATGLRRRLVGDELKEIVGERVHRSFSTLGRLHSHDALNEAQLVELAPGVEVNRLVADADLVIDLVVATRPEHTGWQQLATGVTSARTAWAQLGYGSDDEVRAEVAGVLAEKLSVCQIEVVLDQQVHPQGQDFLSKREWEWNVRDQARLLAMRRVQQFAPQRVRRQFFDRPAQFGVLQVTAGAVDSVAAQSRELLLRQQQVKVVGQSDIVLAGPAAVTEHNVGAVMNPLAAAWDVLGRSFNDHSGLPAVREGGVLIAFHPLVNAFNSHYHSAAADFFAEVLPETTDAARIHAEFEDRFTADEWYSHLYRTQNAAHGTQPLQLWYAMQTAVEHCGDIIWVGADRASAERMGFRAATTLADALEMASATVGRTPSLTLLHTPPALIADVSA